MEEVLFMVTVPLIVGKSVCDNSTVVATHMDDVSRFKLIADAGSLTDSVTEVSTDRVIGSDVGHSGVNLDVEVGIAAVTPPEPDRVGDSSLSSMISHDKSAMVTSEEEDSLSLEGDQLIDSSCSLSAISENSSVYGEEFIGSDATSEFGTPCSIDIEKSICPVNIAGRTADLGESNVDTDIMSESHAVAVSLDEETGVGSGPNPSPVDLSQEKQVNVTVGRSVFELVYTPLWGFISLCGRRPEMEDAVATVPRFLKIPIQMLIGDRVLDGLNQCYNQQMTHFFGVYDGHGGSQVAKYCRERMHLALAEEIEFVKEGLVNGSINDDCQDQWKKAFTNCFLKVDAEVGGKVNNEPVAPETVGSTAVVALISSSHIIVSNCGDSRAVLCRGKEPLALSVDHKPNREDEYARIEAAGGKVIQWNGHRVFGVLAMSRSIGNLHSLFLRQRLLPGNFEVIDI
ncbi:probable protein phosphatase 2C 6 isoform X2 [Lotus japonicus]|uniref:probable protein phosphatase 2C 6 isoform X2 n=1 Tax=Lotus japonicus TaxID=34305 RepID=UPI002588A761|nr:probable protein phosphatase 2C 6 isoform X2 [Lotus japonicus]